MITFCCDFSILNNILLISKATSSQITNEIAKKLCIVDNLEPTIIAVEDMMGKPLVIKNIEFIINHPMEKNQDDEWIESPNESLYIIDNIKPQETFIVVKHLKRI